MDKPDVFMPLYIGDYLAGTSRLTTELHGAYLLLIMDYWMNGPLPDDDSLLSSIVKMTPDAWSIARAKLEYYFSVSDGLWNHKRIEEELASATEKKLKARDKAKKAANARWHGAQSIATSTPQALLKECPSPSPSPSTVKTKDKDLVPTKVGTSKYSDEFEVVWLARVKREGNDPKAGAYKYWKANLKRGVTPEAMTDGMARYKKFCEAKKSVGTEGVQMLQTFLGPNENYLQDWNLIQGVQSNGKLEFDYINGGWK